MVLKKSWNLLTSFELNPEMFSCIEMGSDNHLFYMEKFNEWWMGNGWLQLSCSNMTYFVDVVVVTAANSKGLCDFCRVFRGDAVAGVQPDVGTYQRTNVENSSTAVRPFHQRQHRILYWWGYCKTRHVCKCLIVLGCCDLGNHIPHRMS